MTSSGDSGGAWRHGPALDRLKALLRGDGVLVLLFLALLGFYLTYTMQLRGGLLSDVVGPRTFPILLGVIGLGLCAIFVVQRLLTVPRQASADGADEPARANLSHLVPLGITVAYALLMTTVGYVPATFVYTTVMVKLLGQRTWWGSAVFAVCLTLATALLFTHVFEVRLPAGDFLPRIV